MKRELCVQSAENGRAASKMRESDMLKIQTCTICGEQTDKCEDDSLFHGDAGPLCESCFDALERIDKLMDQGHSHHCACRQVWGDGECECDLYGLGYDPYKWIEASINNNPPASNQPLAGGTPQDHGTDQGDHR